MYGFGVEGLDMCWIGFAGASLLVAQWLGCWCTSLVPQVRFPACLVQSQLLQGENPKWCCCHLSSFRQLHAYAWYHNLLGWLHHSLNVTLYQIFRLIDTYLPQATVDYLNLYRLDHFSGIFISMANLRELRTEYVSQGKKFNRRITGKNWTIIQQLLSLSW